MKSQTMRSTTTIFIAVVAWFAVISQFVLMMNNRVTEIGETVVRFFSFYTILTNSLVAVYFSFLLFKGKQTNTVVNGKTGMLTAVTVYIFVVGLVYQLVLRGIWNPYGMQRVVDELLHTIIPLLVILFWWLFEDGKALKCRMILSWLIYPLVYLVYVLIRGHFTGFYPYPFLHIDQIGWSTALINILFLVGLFVIASVVFLWLAIKKSS